MGNIQILSDDVINKIAAGEVVERPASVVKELIDNALDAKATRVTIDIEDGGKKKITVIDNGEGMDKDDIKMCFHRHGTSKITTAEDLLRISSLGFRGEALSSISSVSNMTVKSKTKGPTAGTLVQIEKGEAKKISKIGMPQGTSVTVEELFVNVPARKKFLKSTATELRHITEIVVSHALAFSNVGFRFTHNRKTVFELPESQEILERISSLLGDTISSQLLPVFFDHPHLKISGFIATPQVSTERAQKQYVFINQRRVKDHIIPKAVRDAYSTLLFPKSYPVFVLFFTLPTDTVDVNVHPRKEEVRFMNNSFVFQSVHNAVSRALQKHNLTFVKGTVDSSQSTPLSSSSQFVSPLPSGKPSLKPHTPPVSKILPQELLPWEKEELRKTEAAADILQVHNLYLIQQTKNGILIVDQHAAHERILYEQFLEQLKKTRKADIQPLLVAKTFDLPSYEADVLKKHLHTFQQLGFDIEEFGGNSFKVNTIPSILQPRNIVALITEVMDDLLENTLPRAVDLQSKKIISYLACRSAVKAGDLLAVEERKDILEKLARTHVKYTCPHGRPVNIEISLKELKKMFKRT